MAWQFWKKTEMRQPLIRVEPTIEVSNDFEWPIDANSAIDLLLKMYLEQTRPFTDWKSPGAVLTPEVMQTVLTLTQSYQLALWFNMFADKHGVLQAGWRGMNFVF